MVWHSITQAGHNGLGHVITSHDGSGQVNSIGGKWEHVRMGQNKTGHIKTRQVRSDLYDCVADPEKHEKFIQFKFDIFFLHKPFSGFYKGNRGQNKDIYTDLKKCTQTWFAGFSCCFWLAK